MRLIFKLSIKIKFQNLQIKKIIELELIFIKISPNIINTNFYVFY